MNDHAFRFNRFAGGRAIQSRRMIALGVQEEYAARGDSGSPRLFYLPLLASSELARFIAFASSSRFLA